MEEKFKAGDRIEYTDSDYAFVVDHWNQYWRESEGNLEEIYAVSFSGNLIGISNRPGGSGPYYDAESFRKARESAMTPKFKVGDRVVSRDYMFGEDCYGTVDVVDGNGYIYATDWTVGCPSGHIHSGDLELAPPPFKAGEVIRVTTDQDTWVYSGMVGTVLETAATNMHVDFGNDKVWWVDYVNAEAAPLHIEAGKYYVDTTGKRVGPMRKWSDDTSHPWECPRSDGDIYRVDGSSDYGPNLVREAHIFELREVVKDGVTVNSNSTDRREPKFKVGDRIEVAKSGMAADVGHKGRVGPRGEYQCGIVKTKLIDVVWDDTEGRNGQCNGGYFEDTIRHATSNTAIVAKLASNGTPRPTHKPYVHANVESAKAEAQRLADMTPGTEFAVYERVDIRKVEKKYDHEWQRLAVEKSSKAGAIAELKKTAGITTAQASRIVYDYAA
ncbi:MAG: hypothetical protein CL535_16575 [Ahrensia sp.]|nr:hypothetical protein [Ahrensia sp.]MBV48190.1 hypothetical protein [Roseobacter sp.]MBV48291.1 hypothetical protein [Roseobacter sp.]